MEKEIMQDLFLIEDNTLKAILKIIGVFFILWILFGDIFGIVNLSKGGK